MIEVIKNIHESPAGSFSFVLGMMILAGWLIHYVTKYVVSANNTIKKLDALKCDVHSKKIDTLELKTEMLPCDIHTDKLDYHSQKLNDLKTDIAVIKTSLNYSFGSKDPIAKKKSPIVLTEIGEELVASNNLASMVDENWGKISSSLKNLNTNNPYDLQEFCIDTAFADTLPFNTPKFLSDLDIDKLKRIAYNSEYPLLSITRAVAVLIRDRYFSENQIKADEQR